LAHDEETPRQQMAQHIHQFRRPEAFSHWFAALTHNAARQWLRRERTPRQTFS
jgi:DNA-directed RNA polymerase specialized sigma24 family protein